MKKIVFTLIYLLAGVLSIKSQALYSTTFSGLNGDNGTITKFIPATNTLTVVKSFEASASTPSAGLIQATDGKLYGMARQAIANSYGEIFSVDPSSGTHRVLKAFNNTDGGFPEGSLMQASDGKLYGMTLIGGSSDLGVIFSYDFSTDTYTKLKDFDGTSGGSPQGSLIQANDGKLYGMSSRGGIHDYGVIFSFDPSTSTYTKLKDFDGLNGREPQGSLMQANGGKFYGTAGGGKNNSGVIFSFDPASATFTKLRDFDGTNGENPLGNLVQASDEKLYGMTWQGGSYYNGVIFAFDPASYTYTKLHDFYSNFDNGDGDNRVGSLIEATDGKLYSMTGGSTGGIFSFDPISSTYKKLKIFDEINVGEPVGSLVQASNGKLYGSTQAGGFDGHGALFSFDLPSLTYARVKDYGTNESGSGDKGLVQASNGKLYGTTSGGGRHNVGVIFSFEVSSSTYTKLVDFDNADGARPEGSLVQPADGKFYGTTPAGGSRGNGVIFSFDPVSSTYKKLKDFISKTDGLAPAGGLMEAIDGKLYGVTYGGGSNSVGVIFSYDPSTSTYKKVKDFDKAGGYLCRGNLMQASDGKLYGTTSKGGSSSEGVLFSFDPSTSTYIKLKDFKKPNGEGFGGLIQASDGKLYCVTRGGGYNSPVLFSFDPTSSTYATLKDFGQPFECRGRLLQASDGKLYGGIFSFTTGFLGFIFSFDPISSTYTKLKDYDGLSAFIEAKESGTPPTVSLITPANKATYLSAGNVYLTATASDADGTITKVEFYNDTTLLYTATDTPYTFKWQHVSKGSYTLTAEATDNIGLVTSSDTVRISVVPNKAPSISIISPANGTGYHSPANINLEAAALDPDGRIIKVDFYNGPTLLNPLPERKLPYMYQWQNVAAGTYTITAKAMDNWGAVMRSAPVMVNVVSTLQVGSKRGFLDGKTATNEEMSLQLAPNPANSILHIYITGLRKDKQATLSVISSLGVVIKTKQIPGLINAIPIDVSSLARGMYSIKMAFEDKIIYRQFVKL